MVQDRGMCRKVTKSRIAHAISLQSENCIAQIDLQLILHDISQPT